MEEIAIKNISKSYLGIGIRRIIATIRKKFYEKAQELQEKIKSFENSKSISTLLKDIEKHVATPKSPVSENQPHYTAYTLKLNKMSKILSDQLEYIKQSLQNFQKNLGPHDRNFFACVNNKNFLRGTSNEILAKGKRLFLHLHLKLCELCNVIFRSLSCSLGRLQDITI